MATNDEIIYSPYLFGYTDVDKIDLDDLPKKISISVIVPQNPKNNISTILGGVGLAVFRKIEARRPCFSL